MPFEWREVVNTRGMTRHQLEISGPPPDGHTMELVRDTRFEALHAMREWLEVEMLRDGQCGCEVELLRALNEAETHDR